MISRSRLDDTDFQIAMLDAKLFELRAHEEQVSSMLSEIVKKRRALEDERAQLEESKVAINRLPNELLVQIYHHILDASPPIDSDIRVDSIPLRLSHVCRRWRDVAIGTPRLWQRIILHPLDMSNCMLTRRSSMEFFARSNGQPTEVYFNSAAKGGHWTAWPATRDDQLSLARSSSLSPSATAPVEICCPTSGHVLSSFPSITVLDIHSSGAIIFETSWFLGQHYPSSFRTLEHLSLSLADCTPGDVINLHTVLLRLRQPENVPDEKTRFPLLASIHLTDIPVTAIPLCRLPSLTSLSVEFTVRFDRARHFPFDFLLVFRLARLLYCAPNVERIALLNAGPVYNVPLDRDVDSDAFWANDAAWKQGPLRFAPITLVSLLEFEYTGIEPQGLYHFLSFFPSPALRAIDVQIAEMNALGFPLTGPQTILLDVLPPGDGALSYLTIPHLHILRVEVTYSEGLRGPFLRLVFPALEHLTLVNTNLCPRTVLLHAGHPNVGHPVRVTQTLPPLLRPDSIFRDPRLPRLRTLSLTAFALEAEHAQTLLAYAPALRRLACDIVLGAGGFLSALQHGPPFVCPQLSAVELWGCDDVSVVELRAAVERRCAAAAGAAQSNTVMGRAIKPLKRVKGVPVQIPSPMTPGSAPVAKVAKVSVTGCKLILEDAARAMERWGVEVDWAAGVTAEPSA
ncbi:hypothetical protein K488DRAFT_70893 [Vararia minispora EC-137]|uniref:Uncharacterized protein n=1 Tax=Vararia minispora EC-137 TaxID=1314806 RepID=A0ACB8QJQ6_9AGAM|nr:hypothetical protein K488DRAFT_70893 [Vararia minispora EC-137]